MTYTTNKLTMLLEVHIRQFFNFMDYSRHIIRVVYNVLLYREFSSKITEKPIP